MFIYYYHFNYHKTKDSITRNERLFSKNYLVFVVRTVVRSLFRFQLFVRGLVPDPFWWYKLWQKKTVPIQYCKNTTGVVSCDLPVLIAVECTVCSFLVLIFRSVTKLILKMDAGPFFFVLEFQKLIGTINSTNTTKVVQIVV